jgi:DNA-binding PadR family transcriptional regulator
VALGQFHIGSVYPILYRLEKGGSIRAEAEEGARRRRSYRITAEGRRVLEKQRRTWRGLVSAIDRVSKAHHA